jgi:hypothetical protein
MPCWKNLEQLIGKPVFVAKIKEAGEIGIFLQAVC